MNESSKNKLGIWWNNSRKMIEIDIKKLKETKDDDVRMMENYQY